jgi:hypothetical protein
MLRGRLPIAGRVPPINAVRLLLVMMSAGIGLAILTVLPVAAVTLVTETFAGSSTAPGQFVSGGSAGACLTAAPVSAPGSIPACPGGPLDPPGQGALRLTDNSVLQTGFAIFTQVIGAGSGLLVEFDQFQYNNPLPTVGADGISFFLVDGSASPTQPGGFGAGLGYAPISGIPGIVGGYIGIGLDDFGNYSVPLASFDTAAPGLRPSSVALRGAESAAYRFITGTTLQPS